MKYQLILSENSKRKSSVAVLVTKIVKTIVKIIPNVVYIECFQMKKNKYFAHVTPYL